MNSLQFPDNRFFWPSVSVIVLLIASLFPRFYALGEISFQADEEYTAFAALAVTDGEFHKGLRSHVIAHFSQALIKHLEPVLEKIMSDLFTALPGSGEIDIYEDVIKQLPLRFMKHFSGLTDEMAQRWSALGEPLMGIDPLMPDDRRAGPAEMVGLMLHDLNAGDV